MLYEFTCSALVTIEGAVEVEADTLEEAQDAALDLFDDAVNRTPKGRGLMLEATVESDLEIVLKGEL